MTGPIAVTGGTGFLGRYIVRALAARGHRPRLLCRHRPVHPQLADLDFEVVAGDLDDRAALDRLLSGADAIVHAAGLVAARTRATFNAVNVAGTAGIAEAAKRTGARFILMSSMAARAPHLSDYARSKADGEAIAESILGPPRDWAILRPTAIYGPWDLAGLAVFRLMGRRIAWLPGRPSARITLIHAADAAHAVTSLVEARDIGGLFEATDERMEGYSWLELAALAASTSESAPRPLFLPPALTRLVARTSLAGPVFSPGKAREILHPDWGSRPEAQLPAAVWRPAIALAQGLTETLRWYRGQGLLPPADGSGSR